MFGHVLLHHAQHMLSEWDAGCQIHAVKPYKKVDGLDQEAAVQISDRGAPLHKAQEVARPHVECAHTPAGTGTPASLYACWIASTTQWDSLAFETGRPRVLVL